MLNSMTGFGLAKTTFNSDSIQVEIRSLNSKNLDVNLRLPSQYRSFESEIRKKIGEHLLRGKIDINISLTQSTPNQSLNFDLIQHYLTDLKKLAPETKESELIATVMRFPNVFITPEVDIETAEKEALFLCIDEALKSIQNYRENEGNQLKIEFKLRVENILDLLEKVPELEEERITKLKQRITNQFTDNQIDIDTNRFEQELIYYLEKLDISEEKQRLKVNCDYFIEMLNSEESNGKKLGFIAQEIGREINTLGAKSNHQEMQKLVVQMKDELEKIKEQVLNTL